MLGLALGACDIPRDPESTLARVRGQQLVVGLLDATDDQERAERRSLEALASALDATLIAVHENPHRLLADLKAGKVHLIAGGLPRSSPIAKHMGLSRTVGTIRIGDRVEERVFGIRKGENAFLLAIDSVLYGLR